MPQSRRALALIDTVSAQRDKGLHVIRAEVVGEQKPDGATARSSADVYVFESIGGWFGVTADDFVRDVAGLDVEHIDLHLNSPGGEASEGVAIANVLRQHSADVTVWVDGLAASAASVIAMAGDEVVMNTGSQLMIHDPWTVAMGDAAEMRKSAGALDSTANALASTYASKAGGTSADWRAVMEAETWYTAEEAVSAGLADRVATADDNGRGSGEQVVPGASSGGWAMWDSLAAADRHLSAISGAFRYAGRAQAPPPPNTPAATASGSTQDERSKPVAFTDEQLGTLRTKLGLAADASEDEIVGSVTEVMEKFVEELDPVVVNKLPEGTVAIDKVVLDELRANATAGREAREQQQASRREQLVLSAIKDGRIAPASKAAWLTALKVDPDGEKNLASLAPGLVPVAELGHAGNDSAVDPDEFVAVYGQKG